MTALYKNLSFSPPLLPLQNIFLVMLRSLLTTRLPTTSIASRALSTIQKPKTPVDLAHISDNAGAVSQVNNETFIIK